MERYEDFAWVTARALEQALAEAGRELGESARAALLAQYGDLGTFPDARPGLERLKAAGHTMVVFSNGSPAMLDAVLHSSGLGGYFGAVVSVDEVEAYKPSPRTYRHVAERLTRPIEEIRLVSSNPFDVIGAEAAGMQAAWIDRSGGVFDALGPRPEMVVGDLVELADVLPGGVGRTTPLVT